MYAGLEPDMIEGGHIGIVAGGNWYNLFKQYLARPKSANTLVTKITNEYFKNVDDDQVKRQAAMAVIDPITWARRIQNTRILSLRSTNDELMHDELSQGRLFRQYGHNVERKEGWIQSKAHSLEGMNIAWFPDWAQPFGEKVEGAISMFAPIAAFVQSKAN